MTFSPVLPIAILIVVGIALLAFAVVRVVRGPARLAWVLRCLMVLLIVVIALRPALPGSLQGPSASGGLEVYFVVDTTSSMAAEDYEGGNTRLDGVKADIAAIGERLDGAQYSLVTFDAAATQRVPLTTDVTALESAASVLTQEVTGYSHGSSVDEPVDLLASILEASKKRNPGDRRVVFYLGDGEQTTGTTPGSFAALKPLLDGGGVLGYGTNAGGRMLEFDGYGDQFSDLGYIQDTTQSPPTDAISRIDETELRSIASDLGVTYSHRTQPGGLDTVLSGIDVGDLTVSAGKPGGATELYWIAAIPLGLLALAELVRLGGALRELRPARPLVRPRPEEKR